MSEKYITRKAVENLIGRVAMHQTTNIIVPFIVTAIYKGQKPKDVKCLSLEHAEKVYEMCSTWLYKVPLKNGMVLEMGRA